MLSRCLNMLVESRHKIWTPTQLSLRIFANQPAHPFTPGRGLLCDCQNRWIVCSSSKNIPPEQVGVSRYRKMRYFGPFFQTQFTLLLDQMIGHKEEEFWSINPRLFSSGELRGNLGFYSFDIDEYCSHNFKKRCLLEHIPC